MSVTERALRCTATPECLDVVQDALGELWSASASHPDDVGPSDRMLFETALVEILGNIVEHARTAEGRPVDVELRLAVHGDRVEARMHDNGTPPPVEPTGAQMPDDELAEDGRGLALAGAVAELTYARSADGNVWTIVRHRS